ncbi:MAG: mandelate racemase/muconate lactonizing enzyme family protein [Burkholderiales bacterium]
MKIRRIEPITVDIPLTKPVRMAFEEIHSTANLLVRLETTEGVVGWGDAPAAPTMTGETVEGMMAAVRHLAPHIEGASMEGVGALMSRIEPYLFGNYAAKSAIEMALHDALGRTLGRPVHDLLGTKRRSRVPLLRSVASANTAHDVEEAQRKKAEGYVTFKVKVGVANPREDAQRTLKVCEAVGGDGVLVCSDANQGWTVPQAIEYVRAVDGSALAFLEQPVAGEDIEGMAEVAHASQLKLCCDEGVHSMADLRRHHAAGAAHGANLKAIKLGGLKRVYDAAVLCDELGMKVNLACKMAGCGITCAAVMHIAASIPNIDWGMSLTYQYLADDVLAEPLRLASGYVEVPSGPGLGIQVDEAKVRRYARKA